MNIIKISAIVLVVVTLIPSLSVAIPPTPSDYQGYVLVDGEPAPDGTVVYAVISNGTAEYVSESNTTVNGYYDNLVVAPTDDSFIEKPVYFYVKPPGKPARIGNVTEFHGGLVDEIVNLVYITINRPPTKPTLVSPLNGSCNVSTNPTLKVHVTDPDNDSMTVYFYGRRYGNESFTLIGSTNVENNSYASIIWSNLDYDTIYEWYAVADDGQLSNMSDIWIFATEMSPPINLPPYKPACPNPADGETNVSTNPTLSVCVEDPDNDTIDVYFYWKNGTLIGVAMDIPSGGVASIGPISLDYDTTYEWYAVANDGQLENTSDTWTFTTQPAPPVNHPPYRPSLVAPSDGATDVGINVTLKVHVIDPDGDSMDVYFYGREEGASDFDLIGSVSNVANDSNVSMVWSGLDYNKTYEWYAVANDGQLENKSEVWRFTTKSYQNIEPVVRIVKPEGKFLYVLNKKIFRFPKTLIIGKIEIEVSASDPDGNISRVEFYIGHHDTYEKKFVDTTPPFTWSWNERAISRYTIKVIAYDNLNATGVAKIEVLVINLCLFSR